MSLHAFLRNYTSCQNRSAPVLKPPRPGSFLFLRKTPVKPEKAGFLYEISYKYTPKKVLSLTSCELTSHEQCIQLIIQGIMRAVPA